jgi:hypothetical protein
MLGTDGSDEDESAPGVYLLVLYVPKVTRCWSAGRSGYIRHCCNRCSLTVFDHAGVRPFPTRPGIGLDSTRFGSPGAACNKCNGPSRISRAGRSRPAGSRSHATALDMTKTEMERTKRGHLRHVRIPSIRSGRGRTRMGSFLCLHHVAGQIISNRRCQHDQVDGSPSLVLLGAQAAWHFYCKYCTEYSGCTYST